MQLDELNHLEEKVKNLVENLKRLMEENQLLTLELEKLKKDSSINNEERTEIRKRVTTLIGLIDSLDNK